LLMERGCNDSPGTFGMFTVDASYRLRQPLAQFFASQLINLEWVEPGQGEHQVFAAASDIQDGSGHALVTTYALRRPDSQWSLMVVNRDQENPHKFQIRFHNDNSGRETGFAGPVHISTFGKGQYQWRPAHSVFLAHPPRGTETIDPDDRGGVADPDGPVIHETQTAASDQWYGIPAASIMVIRGKVGSVN